MKKFTLKKLAGWVFLTAMLMNGQIAKASTPFKNFYVTMDAYPSGAGTVYMSSDDPDPLLPIYGEEEYCDYKFTSGEDDQETVNGANIGRYHVWLQAKPAEGWKFLGFTEVIKEDYSYTAEDFVVDMKSSKTNPDAKDGYIIWDVNANRGVSRDADMETDDEHDGNWVRDWVRNSGYWPDQPDHHYYAVFTKAYSTVSYAYTGEDESVNRQSETFGTLQISPFSHSQGDPVTLTATPKPGFKFIRWQTVDGEVLSTEAVWNTTADHDVYVGLFEIDDVTIPSTGYMDWITPTKTNFALSAEGLDGEFEAYVVDGINVGDQSLNLRKVDQLPGGTPVILMGKSGETYDLDYREVYWTEEQLGSILMGNTNGQVLSNGNIFVFDNGANGAGFYRVEEGEFVESGRVYIEVPEESDDLSVSFIPVSGNHESSVVGVRTELSASGANYGVDGLRITKNRNGVVVKNGRKFIMR